MNETKYIQKILSKIRRNVEKKKWECIVDDCNEQSTNSHLLQKNGILNNIAEEGHVIELKPTDTYRRNAKIPNIEMKSVGIKKALSLKLFCKKHDDAIFKEIETHPLSFDNYRTHLLLSYRVVCAEIRKKEVTFENFKRILNANTLKGRIETQEIELYHNGTKRGIVELNHFKKC